MAKVFLSAGHGGSDPGACGNGLKEKDINLNIMLACQAELVRHGVTVVCSRTTDANDPVAEEVREANASGADIAMSFHTNAGKGDGSESFYYAGNSNGKRLAELCEKHVKALGQNSRGVKTNNLMFTRETKMTAVLCECAFVDTEKDIAIVDTAAEQKVFGMAYAKAALEYLDIAYKASAPASAPEVKPAATPAKPAASAPKPSGKASLTVDGLWGNETTRALQKALGTPVDGIVSNQHAAYRAANPGLMASSWEWEKNPGKSGSEMVRALQKRVGATQDGFIGPNTIRALQRYLGTTVDGCVSKPSQMVKVMQRKLNAGTF